MTLEHQIGAAIKRIGWSKTAQLSGVNRTMLHRCFGDQPRGGKPHGRTNIETIERVLPVLGLELVVQERAR